MPNTKLRCTVCREYKARDDFYKASSLEKVCSEECWAEMRNSRSGSSPARSGKSSQRSLSRSKPAPPVPRRRIKDPMPPGRRDEVLARDGSNCRFCSRWYSHLHVHHINYKSEGVDHQAHNLITLCDEHHTLMHSNKRHWKPILLAVIWEHYVNGRFYTVPMMEMKLERLT